jgi:hypothetical protein
MWRILGGVLVSALSMRLPLALPFGVSPIAGCVADGGSVAIGFATALWAIASKGRWRVVALYGTGVGLWLY